MKRTNPLAVLTGWLALLVGPAPSTPAADVAGTSTITGRVLNQATGQYLEGARIQIPGSDRSTYTNRLGYFDLTGVSSGTVTVTVSYAGLDSRNVLVNISGQRVEMGEVALTAGIYQLEAVVVPGEREGSALAITQQRVAPNVKNVLSSDTFGNVADENVGNFLLRVPGITGEILEGQVTFIKIRGVDSDLNSVTVDGTRGASGGTRGGLGRAFEIDTFPADLVDTIEVTKAPTPDMDADSIGGSVNLKSKSALQRKGRLISYKVGWSYNTDRKTIRPQGSVMFSDLFGRDRQLGIMFTASFSSAANPRDTIFGAWEPTTETNRPAYYTLSSAGEDYFEHERGGAGIRVDYRLNRNSTVYANLMFSHNADNLYRRRNAFSGFNGQVVSFFDANGLPRTAAGAAATLMPGWTDLITDTVNITFQRAQVERDRWVRTYNLHLGGEQKFTRGLLDYNVNYSPSKGYEWRANLTPTVSGVGFRFIREPRREQPEGGRFVQTSGRDITDPANIVFPSLSFNDDHKRDRIIGGQLNYRQDLDLPVPTYFKTGFRFRMQKPEQFFSRPSYTYSGPGGAALARFLDQSYTYQPRALRGTMPEVRFFHIPTVLQDKETNPQYYTENVATTLRNELINDRTASEEVYAAYLMGGTRIGRLGILAGIRAEETRVEGTGSFQQLTADERARRAAWVGTVTVEENLRRTQAEYGNRRTNRSEYQNFFPGIHFRYELREGLLGRLSYSSGIGRPNFSTIIPNDSVNDTTQRVTSNNTSLRPQFGENFDLTVEYYFRPAGTVSAGVFLKEIKDFIYSTDRGLVPAGPDNGFNGDYAGYTLATQANGGFARISGLELNYQQQFTNLPGIWRGLGAYANHTWLETKGDYGAVGSSLSGGQIPGFVPRSGNLGLSYANFGWQFRAQVTYRGRTLASLNANPALTQYNYSSKRVDLNASYMIRPQLSVFLDVINALGDSNNAPYIYIPERKRGADRFSPSIKMGVSGRF